MGGSVCQKSLAEFAAAAANEVRIVLCQGVYLTTKHISGCKCASCAPIAHKECAQQPAKKLSESPKGGFRQSESCLTAMRGKAAPFYSFFSKA